MIKKIRAFLVRLLVVEPDGPERQAIIDGAIVLRAILDAKNGDEAVDLVVNYADELDALVESVVGPNG